MAEPRQTCECVVCGREIESCACCDEHCEQAICHRDLLIAMKETIPKLHEHGG